MTSTALAKGRRREAMRRMGEAFMPGPAPGPGPVSETRTETESTRAARARQRRKIRRNEEAQLRRCPSWAFHRAPCRIRTDDLRITSALLWPD